MAGDFAIIHTSDWHLGHTLYNQKRYEEQEEFLEWLLKCLQEEQADALLVAGDIFDTGTPSNRALKMYYNFLGRVSRTGCRHVVIVGGNHDSPSLLNAPGDILEFLNIHVIGSVPEDLSREVITLPAASGAPGAVICAVPYLRERDIRRVESGESIGEKERKHAEGIQRHYREVCRIAASVRGTSDIPIIAMGHLFATGGETVRGDGVRELYIGNLGHVDTASLPQVIDYLALGHLHSAQRAGHAAWYSGSPLPMRIGESRRNNMVLAVLFHGKTPRIKEIPVPVFQRMERISGDMTTISREISRLKNTGDSVWLEVDYQGTEIAGDLIQKIRDITENSRLRVLRIRNSTMLRGLPDGMDTEETLDDLDAREVFQRCLDAHKVPETQRPALIAAFTEILADMYETDVRAE